MPGTAWLMFDDEHTPTHARNSNEQDPISQYPAVLDNVLESVKEKDP
jgi:hypothetical protein